MKKALLMAMVCCILLSSTCLAAGVELSSAEEPPNSPAMAGDDEDRTYTYSTADRDIYNFAHISLSGTTIHIQRRGIQLPDLPDDISIRLGRIPVRELGGQWGEGYIDGSFFGYNAELDVGTLYDGEYTLSIVGRTSTIVEDTDGKFTRYSYPYTLASVKFVKAGEVCYIPGNNTIAYRHNSSLLQLLQDGDVPDDFSAIKNYYGQGENGQVLEEIEEKVAEITAGLYTDQDKCLAIYQWIVNNISYDYDFPRENIDEWLALHQEDTPRLDNPLNAFEHGYAMCYGYAKLTTLMLGYAGVDSVYIRGGLADNDISSIVGETVNADEYNHGWNAVRISGSWYFLDTCKDSKYGYYRANKTNPETGYIKLNRLPSYIYAFPSLGQLSETHIALRYGAANYGKKVPDRTA